MTRARGRPQKETPRRQPRRKAKQPSKRDRITHIYASLITSENPDRLTKGYSLDPATGEIKKESAGQMIDGHVERLKVNNPRQLAGLRKKLKPNQALIFGLPPENWHRATTKKRLAEAAEGTIARTKDFFTWNPGPGWMMLDYDPAANTPALPAYELIAALYDVAPELEAAPMLWATSSSSHIFNAESGEDVSGLRGQRVYILVADAEDISRAGKALFDRLWLAGHGYYRVSKSGSLLERTLIDDAVWQPNRVDFAAAPVCEPPLEARPPKPEVYNNAAPPLDTMQAIPDLTKQESKDLVQLRGEMRKDKELRARQEEARDAWVQAGLNKMPEGATEEERQQHEEVLRKAVTDQILHGEFVVILEDGETITVGELLSDPDKYHDTRCPDPLEPDYDDDSRVAWINLKRGKPCIYSHARGGVRYTLVRSAIDLKIVGGEIPNALPTIFKQMRLNGDVFERAGSLVDLADDQLFQFDKHRMKTYLEKSFRFQVFDGRAKDWVTKDCPTDVAERVLAERGRWGMPKVSGTIKFPVMRPDGSILEHAGYDEATGLLLLLDDPELLAPLALGDDELRAALQRIWEPFELFPFEDDLSRGVYLAALLTTVCRATLPTAPAFLVRAHAAGTGKTLLSECLMLLVGASLTAMPLPERNGEEIEKRLFAKLLTGSPGLLLDNLQGIIDNAAMCVMLTSAEPEGRILGKSETARADNRALWVLNGNNVTAGGDTYRRILPITLDANCEEPERRQFSFNPLEVIRGRLDDYRLDLLSVLLSYQAAGAPALGKGALGSFTEWDRLVRQCVCWLIDKDLLPVGMADNIEATKLNRAEDPAHQRCAQIFEAWHQVFGTKAVLVREIKEVCITARGDPHRNELDDLLRDVAYKGENFDGRLFNGWLRRNKGQVVNGYRLDPDTTGKYARWTLQRVGEDLAS